MANFFYYRKNSKNNIILKERKKKKSLDFDYFFQTGRISSQPKLPY
jgi:hypothetical protein